MPNDACRDAPDGKWNEQFSPTAEGFYVGTLTNVKALKEEPKMPPEDEVRSWVQLSYRSYSYNFNWGVFGSDVNRFYSIAIEPSKEIEQKALELTNGASTNEEKVKRIYDFTRTQIRNITFDVMMTDEQKAKIEIKTATETLKRRMGHLGNINILFAALLKAVRINTALILAGDRSENFFNPDRNVSESNIHPAGIVVFSSEGQAKLVNAGNPYLPYGKLFWFEEGSYAMIASESSFQWKKLPAQSNPTYA